MRKKWLTSAVDFPRNGSPFTSSVLDESTQESFGLLRSRSHNNFYFLGLVYNGGFSDGHQFYATINFKIVVN